jgi:Zn-dependent alcohol dehydrogenase
MKLILPFILCMLISSVASCKKCLTCERTKFCATCFNAQKNVTVMACTSDFEYTSELDDYISERQYSNGDSCSKVPAGMDEKKVCSSGGLFSHVNEYEYINRGYTCR